MEYRDLQQITADAEIRSMFTPENAALSKCERLERWATLLDRQPERELRSIDGTEYGTRAERLSKRADGSPLSVAFADPLLREEGLRGDRVGDAVEFFGLSEHRVHDLVCYCHNGLTLAPGTVAARVRSLARSADSRVLPRMGTVLAGASAIAGLGLFFSSAVRAPAITGGWKRAVEGNPSGGTSVIDCAPGRLRLHIGRGSIEALFAR